jgi:hypothetical protein
VDEPFRSVCIKPHDSIRINAGLEVVRHQRDSRLKTLAL